MCVKMKYFRVPTALLMVLPLLFTAPLRAQNSMTIAPIDASVGATSLYRLEFALPDSLPVRGALSIVFPQQFDLSNVKIAASSTIKGGFTTAVVGQEVIVVRKGEGDLHRPGERVDLLLSAVKNPEGIPGSYVLKLSVHADGSQILEQLKNNAYTRKPDAPGVEGNVSLSANQ